MIGSGYLHLYEAIATSAPRTLSGSQGIGLVVIASDTPEKIRSLATGSGYPSYCDGHPILSMQLVESDGEWVVFSRLIRDTDYTGRTSFLNHVIAVRKENVFDAVGTVEFSPFELALSLPWREQWDHGREVPSEISPKSFDVEKVERIPSSSFDVASLLAFSNDRGEPPSLSPIKAVWFNSEGGPPTPEQIVCRFHQAWMQVDPWRSCEPKKNEGRFGEPTISIRSSWGCTFLTQYHTSVRADEFLWIHANSDKRPDLNRQVVGETESNEEIASAAKQRHGEETVRVLESRVMNPQEWRRERCDFEIRNINEKLKLEWDEIVKISREKADHLLKDLQNWTLKINVDQWLAHVLTTSKHGKEVREFQVRFDNIRGANTDEMRALLDKHTELQREVRMLSDLAGCKSGDCLDAGGDSLPPLLNSEYEKRFHDARLEAEKCCPFLEIAERYKEILQKDNQIKIAQKAREEIEQKLDEINSKHNALLAVKRDLEIQKNTLESEKKEAKDERERHWDWAIKALLAVLVLLVVALFCYFIVSIWIATRSDPATSTFESGKKIHETMFDERQPAPKPKTRAIPLNQTNK